jgi:hypothetical protein
VLPRLLSSRNIRLAYRIEERFGASCTNSINSPDPKPELRQKGRIAAAGECLRAGAKDLRPAMLDLDAIPSAQIRAF